MHDPPARKPRRTWRIVFRALTGIFFALAGVNHFLHSQTYCSIIPPRFPAPALLVALSGFFEIAGGIGLVIRPLRRASGWGLIALLIAVFPANFYMWHHSDRFADGHIPQWLLLLRLPLQGVMIVWVWHISRDDSAIAQSPV